MTPRQGAGNPVQRLFVTAGLSSREESLHDPPMRVETEHAEEEDPESL